MGMTESELVQRETWGSLLTRYRGYIYGASIFFGVYFVYLLFTPVDIINKEHVYLAQAMLHGSFDVGKAGMPADYIDTVTVGAHRYIPFPPGPAILLLPFVAIWGTSFSESQFAAALGAVNVVIFWQVLIALGISRRAKMLLVPFFAFGTVEFYCATEGAVWQYNHVAAMFFMLVAALLLLRKAPLALVAFVFGFAVISRLPTLLAVPGILYYVYYQHNEKMNLAGLTERAWLKDVAAFCVGLAPFGLLTLGYDYARFHNFLTSGYHAVYLDYINGQRGIYSYYKALFPNATPFKLFDPRAIPWHLYTLFLMPPRYVGDWSVFRPSPYGMSVLLTSPAFVYALMVKRKTPLKAGCWIAIALVSALIFCHYTQGWVQFGYRFLLDFAPFLLILTALGFDDNDSPVHRRVQFNLVAISIVVCFWGNFWAHRGF
jgi:hypothetical protein